MIEKGIETAQAITDFGLLVVIAAFFIVMSVTQQIILTRRYNKLLEQNDARYYQLLKKLTGEGNLSDVIDRIEELIKSTNDLVAPIQKLLITSAETSKEECTFAQASRVVKMEIRVTRQTLIDNTKQIIIQNNVHENFKHTKFKVDKMVSNCIEQMKRGLNLYKYNGMKLTYGLDLEDYTETISQTIYTFIMQESEKEYGKLTMDLNISLEEIRNRISQNVGVV